MPFFGCYEVTGWGIIFTMSLLEFQDTLCTQTGWHEHKFNLSKASSLSFPRRFLSSGSTFHKFLALLENASLSATLNFFFELY